ncbi:protein eva-1 homolog B-like [Astyanax mexicanus]|uniref:protein eva-1 homolog B-like n=1 Tax=Astyanax mexicanus TaxID=7994 RepID=UPI0020CB358F|nr:protein eva-1 homolog B-like [Astyanax mexicanus]
MNPVRKDMELLSNSMATYAHIKENVESFALYFMLGVCFGLLLAMTLLILGIACRRRTPTKKPSSPDRRQLKESSEEDEDEDEGEDEEVGGGVRDEEEAEVPKVVVATMSERSQSNGTLRSANVFNSAEELERARRLEERERIVREIWRNGQPDILLTGTGTLGRVHYR